MIYDKWSIELNNLHAYVFLSRYVHDTSADIVISVLMSETVKPDAWLSYLKYKKQKILNNYIIKSFKFVVRN